MVVCAGIKRAIEYKKVFDAYLAERKSPVEDHRGILG
jgi:hypothetical protein